MQNARDLLLSSAVTNRINNNNINNNNNSANKIVEHTNGDVIKKINNRDHNSTNSNSNSNNNIREGGCRVLKRVTRDQTNAPSLSSNNNNNNQNDKDFRNSNTTIADKYVLLDQVEGSSLFRCVDMNTKEELVCKIVSRDNHSLVSAHYKLDSHPRVSSIHELLVGNRYLYLVFPKAHGDLHSYVRSRKRLRETEAKKLFRQMAETVQECHKHNIVLRDLKLRKFVFADSQRTELKLESLEDAVVLEERKNDLLHDKRGCPAYVSPEILKAGSHYSGKAADMWSLGVILYTMLVGRYPFNDSEHASLFAKISRGHFVIPECVSSRAKCLIRSLLRKEPSERISSEDILFHPWLSKEDRDWTSRACDQLVPELSMYDED